MAQNHSYYQSSFLRTQVCCSQPQLDGVLSSDSSASPNSSTDDSGDSSPATSASSLHESSPLRNTLADINMGDTDAELEQSQGVAESQTSTSSADIDQAMQAAWKSMASSQGSQTLLQPSPTEVLQLPSEMDLDESELWQSQAALESQSLLLSGDSSSSQFSQQEPEPGKNYASTAESAMSDKQAIDQTAEDEGEELPFQSSTKRPTNQDFSEDDVDSDEREKFQTLTEISGVDEDLGDYDADSGDRREEFQFSTEMPGVDQDLSEYDADSHCNDKTEGSQSSTEMPGVDQDLSEYDADSDSEDEEIQPIMHGDRFQCPRCSKSYSKQRSLTRHRHSVTQLKCLDLEGVTSLRLFLCSEPGCRETNDRRDVMIRHVRRKHNQSYNPSAVTTKHFSANQLRELMKKAQARRNHVPVYRWV